MNNQNPQQCPKCNVYLAPDKPHECTFKNMIDRITNQIAKKQVAEANRNNI